MTDTSRIIIIANTADFIVAGRINLDLWHFVWAETEISQGSEISLDTETRTAEKLPVPGLFHVLATMLNRKKKKKTFTQVRKLIIS